MYRYVPYLLHVFRFVHIYNYFRMCACTCSYMFKRHACGCVLQRHSIGTTSVQYAHWFLKEMSDEVNQVITAICEEQCMLADKVHTSDVTCFHTPTGPVYCMCLC